MTGWGGTSKTIMTKAFLYKKKNKLKGRIPSLCSPIISLRNVFDKPSDEFDRGSMLVYYNFYFYI